MDYKLHRQNRLRPDLSSLTQWPDYASEADAGREAIVLSDGADSIHYMLCIGRVLLMSIRPFAMRQDEGRSDRRRELY